MAKAKSPKFHLSLLTSFQICRPKTASSMIKGPFPNPSYLLSPLNSKTFDISFPGTPAPPPSTPSKIVPLDCGFSSPFACSQYYSTSEHIRHSPNSSDDCKKKHKNTKYKSRSCIKTRTSSSEYSNETDSLFSSPPSLSHHHSLKTVYEDELFNGVKKQTKPRRFKRYGSKEWKEREEECEEKKAVLGGRSSPCMKVDHIFVVVKKSVYPYQDFKKSMLEMIVEKQTFEPKELEELLMSFLTLNSRLHHKVIIEAFTEILKDAFC